MEEKLAMNSELVERYRFGSKHNMPFDCARLESLFPGATFNLEYLESLEGVTTIDAPIERRLCFVDAVTPEIAERLTANEFKKMLVVVPKEAAGSLIGPHVAADVSREAYAALVCEMFGYHNNFLRQTRQIDPTSQIDDRAVLSVGVVVGRGSSIGSGTKILPNVVIGPNVTIGKNCLIKSGTVIGQPGFGVLTDKNGNLVHLPQVGGVVIENEVEIGSLNTVCAGTIHPTTIGYNVKVDDHVHIAHNCIIGSHTIITACTEFSGSVIVGARCWVGPNSSIRNGLSLGDNCFVGIGSNVVSNVAEGITVAGNPARPIRTS